MVPIYLHSGTISKFGKHEKNVLELSLETASAIIPSFDIRKIDLLVFTSFAPENYSEEYHLAAKLASALCLNPNTFCIRTETASSSGASAFHTAIHFLRSGKFKNALVVGTEIMTRFDREKNNLLLGSVLSDMQRRFAMSMAQGAALLTNRYLYEYGYVKKDLFSIAEKLHTIGASNPKAHIQKKISLEDYLQAPIFSDPLGLYDISPLSDGSASILLSSEIPSGIQVKGTGSGISRFGIVDGAPRFTASEIAFREAYLESGVHSNDIQIAELHDAFTPFEVIAAEDAGLFPRGKGLKNVIEGVTHPRGKLPINSSGGLKTRGHPIGASGLAQIVEISRLMKEMHKAIGLVHSIGGLATNNFVTILERTK